MSAYDAIPKDSRAMLDSAVRMMQMDRAEMSLEEIALMIYNLGRIDGQMQQRERAVALLKEVSDTLDPFVDVRDGEDGPQPNQAMSLKSEVDDMIERLR